MTDLELLRDQWADGYRRVEQLVRDPRQADAVHGQVALLLDELRRRFGSTYTLDELAGGYPAAERWVYEVLEERTAGSTWIASAAASLDAAFHRYARGAQDYSP